MLQLPGFEIREELYQGARTHVYRARRLDDERAVVLKTTASNQPSPLEISRISSEFQLGRSLDDPHVVRFVDLVQDGHRPVLVLEDRGGRALARLLGERRVTLVEALAIAKQVAQGLAALHRGRIVHRDVNPANIIIVPATTPTDLPHCALIDLGIASMLESETRRAAPTRDLEGTLLYLSPEQTGRMSAPIDQRADFYALGVTLYQMLAGELPFRSSDDLEIVHAHIARQPPPLTSHDASLPPVVVAIVERLLAKAARDRYQTAEGLTHDLDRCLRAAVEGKTIESFPLGERDISSKLRIPDKLYGRHRERDQLREAFSRAQEGGRLLLLLSGPPGSGKSALARELLAPVTQAGGWLVTGCFDAQGRERPYSAIIEAISELVQQLLTRSTDEVRRWQQMLQQAVGEDGQVLIDVLPQVSLLLGAQPPARAIGPAEAERRFTRLMRVFFRLLATRERPLVLLLDDLHHADAPSLRLLELLLADDEIHHLLVVGTHRGGLEGTDPLKLMRRAVKQGPAELLRLRIEPLEVGHITRLLVDALHCTSDEAEPLAELLHEKTLGNPFFLHQTLQALASDRLLQFSEGRWRWDLAQIERRDLAGDVVELLLGKLARLPSATRRVLELAACIGGHFDLGTLSVVAEQRVHQVATALRPAIDVAIVRPQSAGFSQLALHELEASACPMENARQVELAFVHERFRRAAYERLPETARREVHLRLARLLLGRLSSEELEEHIFEVASHFDAAADALTDPAERLEVARLHQRAGLKAQAAVAFDTARRHFAAVIDLLPEDRWSAHYALSFSAYHNYHMSLVLVRDVAPETLALGDELRQNARSDVDRLLALAPHALRLARARKPELALELSLPLLREHGVDLLDVGDVTLAVDRMRERIDAAIGERDIASLVDLPVMSDPLQLAKTELMHALLLSFYMRRRSQVPLLEGSSLLLAIEHGVAPNSSMAFCGWGRVTAHISGDFARGHQLGDVAKRLSDRFGVFRTGAHGISVAFTDWLRQPIGEVLEPLREAFRIGVESGETLYAGLAAGQYSSLAYSASRPLALLRSECGPFLRYIEANMGDVGMREIHLTMRMIDVLSGERAGLLDANEQEDALIDSMRIGNREGIAWYYLLCAQLAALWDRHDEALNRLEAALPFFDPELGQYARYDLTFHRALALAAVDGEGMRATLQGDREKLARWVTAGATGSFGHKLALVDAELARVEGDAEGVGPAFEHAIEAAARVGALADQARANELAARYYRARGLAKVADVYLTEARYCYEKWGATAKVSALEEAFPQLRERRVHGGGTVTTTHHAAPSTDSSSTSHSTARSLDVVTVIKASQAIAREVELSSLLTNLLRIVAENAGAERGFLLLREGEELNVEARYDAGGVKRLSGACSAGCEDLSSGIAHYVARTGEPVLLADASVEGRFRTDPYVAQHRPKSVLCAPIANQGKAIGVVYLENNLAPGAFTDERLEVVQLLGAQAAISVVNARLFAELEQTNRTLEQKVEARTADLAERNSQLGESLQRQQQMQQQLLISEKMASLGNLVAGVAHEINTPVGAMVSSVDTATRATERVRKMIEELFAAPALNEAHAGELRKLTRLFDLLENNHDVIATGGERVAEIVRTLRNFARLDEAERKLANLHEGIDSTLGLTKHRLKKGISVAKDYGDLPEVNCYPNQLNQVFMNLIVNAIDAIEARKGDVPPGQIDIRTRATAKGVELAFSDNGIGIPETKLPEIFNPGFTTKGVGVGTGLGLSIAFNIIDKHGGSIDVRSRRGEGSTFTVTLPVS